MDNLTANIVAALLAVNLCYLEFKQAVVYKDSNTCFNVACKIGIVYGGSFFITDNIFCREGIFTARLKLYGLIVLEALYSYLGTLCVKNSRYRKSEFLSYSFNLLVTLFVILVGTCLLYTSPSPRD